MADYLAGSVPPGSVPFQVRERIEALSQRVLAPAPPPSPHEVGVFIPDAPPENATILRIVYSQAVRYPTNLAGSYVSAQTAPGVLYVLTFSNNGSPVATATLAPGATAAVLSASEFSMAPGDALTVNAPADVGPGVRDISITLKGERV